MMPLRAMSPASSVEISSPLKRIEPESIGCAPAIALNRVVLPEPLGPISPTMAPCSTLRLTWSLASHAAKALGHAD